MVGVAQLVEHLVVVPVVAGSSPVIHPTQKPRPVGARLLSFVALGLGRSPHRAAVARRRLPSSTPYRRRGCLGRSPVTIRRRSCRQLEVYLTEVGERPVQGGEQPLARREEGLRADRPGLGVHRAAVLRRPSLQPGHDPRIQVSNRHHAHDATLPVRPVAPCVILPEDPGRAGDITQEHSAAAVDVADKGRTEAYVARTRRSRRTAHAVVPPPTAPWP